MDIKESEGIFFIGWTPDLKASVETEKRTRVLEVPSEALDDWHI